MNLHRRFIPEPPRLVGTFRRFGSVGPVYEITAAGKEMPEFGGLVRKADQMLYEAKRGGRNTVRVSYPQT